jgi:autophagy-related protein 13
VNSPPGNKAPDYQNVLQQNRFSFDDGPKFGAFADPSSARRNLSSEFMLPELPLPTFMKIQSLKDVKKEQERASAGGSNAAIQKDVEITDDSTQLTTSLGPVSNSDEFVMVESLKTPFAEGDSSHDVGAFFRECQSAPVSLQSFNRPSGMATLEIGSQLEQFEKDLEGYDDLVQSLGIGADEGGKQ